jgi:hypothetical protein|mmetsp:Transcript_81054/g.127663  ORF Transcript_81054/g.127663 Transcript_81054/m.127663 type:complete len:319 (+) Transcript_81054:75-1031(+)
MDAALDSTALKNKSIVEALREEIARKAAENRRRLKENQKLQTELRRVNTECAIADHLHQTRIAGRPSSDSCPVQSDLPSSIAEAEEKSRRAVAEVENLKQRLFEETDREALEAEVCNMRTLVEEMGDSLLKCLATEFVTESQLCVPPSPTRGNDDSLNCSGFSRSDSFEMLETIEEVEKSTEKKHLQNRITTLSRELNGLLHATIASQSSSTAVEDRRRKRQLQQADALAASLHEELRRQGGLSGASTPGSMISERFRRDRVPSEAFAGFSPVTVPSTLPSGPPSASSQGKASVIRARRQNEAIRKLSQRFALRAAVH